MAASVATPVAPPGDNQDTNDYGKLSSQNADPSAIPTGTTPVTGSCVMTEVSHDAKVISEFQYEQEFKINNAIDENEQLKNCQTTEEADGNCRNMDETKALLAGGSKTNKVNNTVHGYRAGGAVKRMTSLDGIPELTPVSCECDPDTCVSLPADFALNGDQCLRDMCNCQAANDAISKSLTALPGEELSSKGGAFVSDGIASSCSQSEDCIVQLRNSTGREKLAGHASQSYTRYISGAFQFLKEEGDGGCALPGNDEQQESGPEEFCKDTNRHSVVFIEDPSKVECTEEFIEKHTSTVNAAKRISNASQRDSSASLVSNLSSLSENSCLSDSPNSFDKAAVVGCHENNNVTEVPIGVTEGNDASDSNPGNINSGVSADGKETGKVPVTAANSCCPGNTDGTSSINSQDATDEQASIITPVLGNAAPNSVDSDCEHTSTTSKEIQSSTKGDNQEVVNPGGESCDPQVVLRKRSSKRRDNSLKTEDSCDQESDDSSDEDSGVYAESHRNSRWIKVEDDGTLMLPSMPYTISEDVDQSDGSVGLSPEISGRDSASSTKDDDVFSEALADYQKSHKRTDSSATTASESDFRNKFRFLRKRSVQRHNSQQQFYRMSTKYYEDEMSFTMEKDSGHADFGIHILDSHPAVISAVIPESTAEKAGVMAGQILVSVNGVNVLAASHGEIIQLIQKNPESLTIAVGQSDVWHSRDLQAPVLAGYLTKLASSGLIKLWRKRWFVLRQDNCLYYYKTEHDKDPLGAVPMTDYLVSKALEVTRDFSFKLEKYGARTYFFAAESDESRKMWANAMTAAAHSTLKTESWLDVTSHNVGIPALSIRNPECTGYLSKLGEARKAWRKRYCVLKDACIYYYKGISSYSAQGVAHLHGYQVDREVNGSKKQAFRLVPPEPSMRTFLFATENATDRERWIESMTKSIGRWKRISTSS